MKDEPVTENQTSIESPQKTRLKTKVENSHVIQRADSTNTSITLQATNQVSSNTLSTSIQGTNIKMESTSSHNIESVFIEDRIFDSIEMTSSKESVKKEEEERYDEDNDWMDIKDNDDYDEDFTPIKTENQSNIKFENIKSEIKTILDTTISTNLDTYIPPENKIKEENVMVKHENELEICDQQDIEEPQKLSADSTSTPKMESLGGKCTECKRKFHDLTRHMVEMHSSMERPFECFECKRTFKKFENIRYHMITHTNERNYICHFCGSAFFMNSEMRKHIANRHQTTRPFGCDQCNKTFKNRHSLNKHLKIHSGVKPYVCSVCSESYAALSSLKIHERRHTGDKPYTCKFCKKSFADSSTHKQHVSILSLIESHQLFM